MREVLQDLVGIKDPKAITPDSEKTSVVLSENDVITEKVTA